MAGSLRSEVHGFTSQAPKAEGFTAHMIYTTAAILAHFVSQTYLKPYIKPQGNLVLS